MSKKLAVQLDAGLGADNVCKLNCLNSDATAVRNSLTGSPARIAEPQRKLLSLGLAVCFLVWCCRSMSRGRLVGPRQMRSNSNLEAHRARACMHRSPLNAQRAGMWRTTKPQRQRQKRRSAETAAGPSSWRVQRTATTPETEIRACHVVRRHAATVLLHPHSLSVVVEFEVEA